MSDCAVVVLFYNKLSLTRHCIDAIVSSGTRPQSIYLFDNGSEVSCSESLRAEYPNVHYKRIEKNGGYAGGFNAGLDWVFNKAGHRKCLFLTNDTLLRKGSLQKLEQCAKEHSLDMVSPLLVSSREAANIDSNAAYFCEKTLSLHHIREKGKDILLAKNEYIPGTAILINDKSFNQLGGCDESYFMYWEDVDFSFRAREKNLRLGRCEEAIIEHGIGKTCHKKTIYTTFYYQRNRIKFCNRWLPRESWIQARTQFEENINHQIAHFKEKDPKRWNYWKEIEKYCLELSRV